MAKIIKKGLMGIGVFFGLLLLLLMGARFYITTNQAQRMVQTRINEAIPGELSWEKFRLSLFKGALEIRNIQLKGPAGDDLMALDRIFVNLSWTSLTKGELTAETLILEKPRVWLGTDRNGDLNLMKAFPTSGTEEPEPSSGGFPFNVLIDELTLTDGFFQYETAGKEPTDKTERVAIHQIGFTVGDGNLLERSGRFNLRTGKGEMDMAGIKTAIDQFQLEGRLHQEQLKPLALKIRSDMGNLDISGSVGNIFSHPLLNLDLDLDTSLSQIRETFHILTPLTGPVQLHLTARGTIDDPEAILALNYKGGNIAGNRVDKVDLNCNLKETLITITPSKIKTPMGRIALTGDIDLRKAFAEGFLSDQRNLEAISYKLFLKQTDTSLKDLSGKTMGITGVVNSKLSLEGEGISPETLSVKAMLELFAEKVAVEKVIDPLDLHLSTQATLEKNTLAIQQLNLSTNDTRLQVKGDYDLSNGNIGAKLMLDAPDLAQLMLSPKIGNPAGKIALNVDLTGSAGQPVVDACVQGSSMAFNDTHLGDLDAALRFAQGTLFLDQIELRNGKSALGISGTARVLNSKTRKPVKDPELDLKLAGEGLFLEDFFKDMKGKLVLNGHIKGDTKHPGGSATLEGKEIDLGVQKIDKLRIATRLDNGQVHIDSFLVALAPGEEIMGEGRISTLDKSYDLRLKSKGISLKHIDIMGSENPVKGKITLNLSGKGSFEDPGLSGDIKINDLLLNNEPFGDLQLRVDLQNQIARISENLKFGLDARFNLETREFSAKTSFHKTDLAPFFKMGGQNDLNGLLTGTIEAKGNAGSPETIRAFADISQLMLFYNKAELVRTGGFTASFENRKISVPSIRLTLFNQGHLHIKGGGSLDGAMDFKADGTIPLEAMRIFAEELTDITGILGLSASLEGTLGQPDLRAEIKLNQVGMTLPGLMQKLHDLNGRIQVTSQSVTLADLRGKLETGSFDLSGKMDLKDFQPVGIAAKLNAHALPLNVPDTLELLLNTDLVISGTPEKAEITGDIVILEGLYHKDVKLNLLEKVGRKTREAPPLPVEETRDFLKNLGLEITVKHRNPFVVDNNMALMALKPTLRVHGTSANPRISGRAQVESGIITYLGKEFEITKGVVDFLNPYKIEPTMEVKSQIEIRDWTIFLEVSGRPDNLKFTLTSDPQEEDGDILSLIAFGKTTKELIKGESGSSTSTKQMLADILAKTLQKNFKDTTGLDTIEMKYTEASDPEASDDINITIGKELSRRMTIKYGVETKDGITVQRATTEYKFIENLLMNAFQDTAGDFGGELVFRLEFR